MARTAWPIRDRNGLGCHGFDDAAEGGSNFILRMMRDPEAGHR
jgi:hypothetical protein